MQQTALEWITRYGYWGIFSLLVFGIVGLPVPDEWLLTFSGYLVFRHTLRFVPAVTSAFLGSACGISISYLLGRGFGTYIVEKYGYIVHITAEHMARMHDWFSRFGRWTLLFGYYIPGVRHLTAYTAGASHLRFDRFALFAYSGALIWSLTFITAGYLLGEQWHRVTEDFHSDSFIVLAGAAGVALIYLTFRFVRKRS